MKIKTDQIREGGVPSPLLFFSPQLENKMASGRVLHFILVDFIMVS